MAIWIEASTIIGLIIVFGFVGFTGSLNVVVFNTDYDNDTVYTNTLYLIMTLGIALGVLLFIFAPIVNAITMRDPVGEMILRLMALLIPTEGLLVVCPHIARLRNRTVASVTCEVMVSLAKLVACVFAAINHDLITFTVLYYLLRLAAIIPLCVVTFWGVRFTRPVLSLIKALGKHGANLSLVSQSSWLVMYGDRLMLSILSVSAAVAIYSASYQLTIFIMALGAPFLYVLLPILGNHWKAGEIERGQQAVRQTTRGMLIIIIPAVCGLILVGDSLLIWLANDDFVTGRFLIGTLAIGLALEALGTSMQYIFYAQGRPQILRNIYLRAAIFNVLANLIAIPLFSYNGAGLVTLLTFAYVFYSLWKRTEMPFSALFDMSVFWRCLLISGVMGVWVALTVAPTLGSLFIAIAGGAAIYGVGLLALRVVSLDEVLAIPRAIIKRFTPQVQS